MADVKVEDLNLPDDVLAKIAELDLDLSEGWFDFMLTQKQYQ